jgi:hypothetical protein
MNAEVAVQRLEANGRKRTTAVRCLGYAALIQAVGWEGIGQHMPTSAVDGLRAAFDEADIDPGSVAFPEGMDRYLEEVIRSSAHPTSAETARRLLDRS